MIHVDKKILKINVHLLTYLMISIKIGDPLINDVWCL